MNKIICLLLLFQSSFLFAQNKYLVVFNDKANSPYSIEQPQDYLSQKAIERREKQGINVTEQDLPVNPAYIQALINADAPVKFTSKWLNAALIDIPETKLAEVLALPFVKGLEGDFPTGLENPAFRKRSNNSGNKSIGTVTIDPGTSLNQLEMLGADQMHAQGFTGKGVLIGLLDSGYLNADDLDVFEALFAENRVVETYNFVNTNLSVYDAHSHGTSVLSCIASSLDGQLLGTAPDASFVLYVTENVNSETKMEEANWLFAAERADSVGVDVVGSSLGYADFEGSEQDYSYQDLDGNTALITRAADWLTSKGVIVVVSAGNEGNKAWKYITAPADGDSVIAVGAVDSQLDYVNFSSVGPSSDGQIKPDVAAKGGSTTVATPSNFVGMSNGTSFAAPLITGLVAGIREAFPDLTAMQIREILLESGTQASQPDNFLGYGIPNFERAQYLASIKQLLNGNEKDIIVFPNPTESTRKVKVLVAKDEYGTEFNVTLTNTHGVEVYKDSFKSKLFELAITPNDLPAGLYILKVYNENFSSTERIMMD
ncbi:S8 family peptidase [Arcticibacterium luteifluviistationis]|uniref:Peptidase S8 n=1 Tax=Arcticibacterium luteifluviistationis TaxID=1784714 RepID=A0A2Z4GBW2_9BACT|nr:S8 family peptidase [Arcticibacterium luteifluviistationis]AWV98413.1 peptidase S8 [Arcticibacterium luteifluviistationis]